MFALYVGSTKGCRALLRHQGLYGCKQQRPPHTHSSLGTPAHAGSNCADAAVSSQVLCRCAPDCSVSLHGNANAWHKACLDHNDAHSVDAPSRALLRSCLFAELTAATDAVRLASRVCQVRVCERMPCARVAEGGACSCKMHLNKRGNVQHISPSAASGHTDSAEGPGREREGRQEGRQPVSGPVYAALVQSGYSSSLEERIQSLLKEGLVLTKAFPFSPVLLLRRVTVADYGE